MIVSELIKQLQTMDPWALVVICPGPQDQTVPRVVPVKTLEYVEIELDSNKFETYRIQPGAAAVQIG